ncbi:MAG: RNA-binding S4 domain-containing protein [Polyangiaceae bacterium]
MTTGLAVTDTVRLDRFLCASRLFKSRTLAQEACEANHVRVNGESVRSSHLLRVGDEIRAFSPRGSIVWQVLKLADKRLGPPEARTLYEDLSPPPAPREERVAVRERGAGRPTKADRRATDRWRGGDD